MSKPSPLGQQSPRYKRPSHLPPAPSTKARPVSPRAVSPQRSSPRAVSPQRSIIIPKRSGRDLPIYMELVEAVRIRPNLGSEAISYLPEAADVFISFKMQKISRSTATDIIKRVILKVEADKNVIVETVSGAFTLTKMFVSGLVVTIPLAIQLHSLKEIFDVLSQEIYTVGGKFFIGKLGLDFIKSYNKENFLEFLKQVLATFIAPIVLIQDVESYRDEFVNFMTTSVKTVIEQPLINTGEYGLLNMLYSGVNSATSTIAKIAHTLVEPSIELKRGQVVAEFERSSKIVTTAISSLGLTMTNTKNIIFAIVLIGIIIVVYTLFIKIGNIMEGRRYRRKILSDDNRDMVVYGQDSDFKSKKSARKSKSVKKPTKKSKSVKKPTKKSKSVKKPVKKSKSVM